MRLEELAAKAQQAGMSVKDLIAKMQNDPVANMLGGIYKGAGQKVGDFVSGTWNNMDTMDKAALTTSPIPILGDAVGLANDARYMAKEPSMMNAGMMAMGAIPFVPSLGMVKAYHGSPHKFDKFSMENIGTGEGAQAYGHGLYFAENPEIAGHYKKTLASGAPGEIYLDGKLVENPTPAQVLATGDQHYMMKMHSPDPNNPTFTDDVIREASELRDSGRLNYNPSGNLYNVNLDVNHEDLLDWDAPLSEQSESVKKAIIDGDLEI